MPSRIPSVARPTQLLAVIVASALIGLAAAICAVSTIGLLPPKLQSRQLQTAGATVHALVDVKESRITDRAQSWPYFNAIKVRAALIAPMAASPPAVEHIARRAGVAADDLAVVAPVTAAVQSVLTEPGSEQRANEIVLARKRYRLEIQNEPDFPVLDIYAQAPSPAEANRLANAAIEGLRDHLRALAVQEGFDPSKQLQLIQLGAPRAGVLNPGVRLKLAGLTFLLAFGVSLCSLLVLLRSRPVRDSPAREPHEPAPRGGGAAFPRGALALATAAPSGTAGLRWPVLPSGRVRALAPAVALRNVAGSAGDWPRTTRALPWMLAVFIAVLWLVPFDSIELNASLPIDLKFDRLVLPIIIVTWALSLIMGGSAAPRIRLTWIHVAVGAFVTLACLSVILNAGELNQGLELDTSLKKLPLLLAYLSLFVMLASVVRRSEVAAFMKYTLVLAVLCALGMIWEYRFTYNVFFDIAGRLPAGLFSVTEVESGFDGVGRRVTHGPAAHSLVAVTMMSMALPIALVEVIHADRWLPRIKYGLAACVIMLAVLATQRKTGVVAPVSVALTLAYFRRRELLRMAPAAVALLIALVIVSPGTIAPVADQFRPDQLSGANTVSDRASDYDAIRPDVWTHLALGRGYGSYQPIGHRILDSEVLVRTVEMGLLGLAGFLLLGASVVATARSTIGSRHPAWAPAALAGAAAAVAFLVVAALFDTMSYPQVPYIFLCFAAFVAAVVKPAHGDAGSTT